MGRGGSAALAWASEDPLLSLGSLKVSLQLRSLAHLALNDVSLQALPGDWASEVPSLRGGGSGEPCPCTLLTILPPLTLCPGLVQPRQPGDPGAPGESAQVLACVSELAPAGS